MIAAPSRRASCDIGLICPACHAPLMPERVCTGCDRAFPEIAGIADLRLRPDRYLSLSAERAKAEFLAAKASTTDFAGLCRAYYDITPDVDLRRAIHYLAHLESAEQRAEAFIDLLPKAGIVLEIGCGTGGMLATASRRGITIEGVDIALRWLVLAKQRLKPQRDVRLTAVNAEHLPWPDSTFTAIYADSVLEHLDNPATALSEWRRVAKPGARLILISPNRFSLLPDPHVRLWGLGFLPRRWQAAYVRRRRNCQWPVRPISPTEARRLVVKSGWNNVRIEAAPAPELPSVVAKSCYEIARKRPLIKRLLRQFGPLWRLTADREGRA